MTGIDFAVIGLLGSFLIPFIWFAVDEEGVKEWQKGARRSRR